AEDIAPTYDNGDLDTQSMDVLNLRSNSRCNLRIDAEALITHQGFAAAFQQNAFGLCVHFAPRAAARSPARSVERFSKPSPVLNLAKRRTWMFSPILPTRLLMSSFIVMFGSLTNF